MRADAIPAHLPAPCRLLLLADTGEEDMAEIVSVITEQSGRNRCDIADEASWSVR